MNEIKSNSDKARMAQQKKKDITPVAHGAITKKKKNGAQKFADTFFAEDIGTIKQYVIQDVIIPTIKNTIHTVITNAADVALYGETSAPQRKIPGAKIAYDRVTRALAPSPIHRNYTGIQRAGYDFGEAIVDTRAQAEAALEALDETISAYGQASVGDLFDIIGVTPESSHYNYGWDTIATASTVRLRDGRYLLRLPKARPLI